VLSLQTLIELQYCLLLQVRSPHCCARTPTVQPKATKATKASSRGWMPGAMP